MHPAVLAGGIGALDAALLGIYALYVKERKQARPGRREVTPFPTYRRPVRRPDGQGQLKGGPGKDKLKGGPGKDKQVQ